MDFETRDTQEIAKFRAAVRAWLDANAPEAVRLPYAQALGSGAVAAWVRGFQRDLADRGWAAPSWPQPYGGGLSLDHDRAVREERSARTLPDLFDSNLHAARQILAGGDETQRARFLRPLLRGETIAWRSLADADLLIDPDAATVLADRDGDVYIVSGAAVFVGVWPQPGFLWTLAVTDREAARDRRLSAFLIPANLDGVDLGSADAMIAPDQHMVLLGEVAVPVEYRIGAEGEGAALARVTDQLDADANLALERQQAIVGQLLAYVRDTLKGTLPNARYRMVRERVAAAYINVHTLRVLSLRNRWARDQGAPPVHHGPQYAVVARLRQDELETTLLDTLGPFALLNSSKLSPFGSDATELPNTTDTGAHSFLQTHLLAESLGLAWPEARTWSPPEEETK